MLGIAVRLEAAAALGAGIRGRHLQFYDLAATVFKPRPHDFPLFHPADQPSAGAPRPVRARRRSGNTPWYTRGKTLSSLPPALSGHGRHVLSLINNPR